MKIALLGDSHIVALGNALAELPAAEREFNGTQVKVTKNFSFPDALRPFFQVKDESIAFTSPTTREEMRRTFGRTAIDSSFRDTILAISMPFTTIRVVRHKTWRTQFPIALGARPRLNGVSSAVMYEMTVRHYQHILSFFKALKDAGHTVLAVSGPPPRLDDPRVARYKPDIVLAADAAVRGIMMSELEKIGVPVVLPPEETYVGPSRTGGLREEYYNMRDRHHANVRYGKLMLAKVIAEASALAPRA
jgi:hypothetical protein